MNYKPTSSFGWIDFSPADRERVGTVLDLIKPSGQVDELGIGTIRDALADRLFPGISTIQTRARYYLIIPYMLWDFYGLSQREKDKTTPLKYLDDLEHQFMWDLAEKHGHNERSGVGVIGITKRRGERIARKPSEIYWAGINLLKCLDSRGLSANAFLNHAYKQHLESNIYDHHIEDDSDSGYENYFHLKVPYHPNWYEELSLDLSSEEASFIKNAFLKFDGSLAAQLLQDQKLFTTFKDHGSFSKFVPRALNMNLPEKLKELLVLAHNFSELMHGAHIAYNQELQRHFFEKEYFNDEWDKWYNGLRERAVYLDKINLEELFALSGPSKAEHFVREWTNLILGNEFSERRKSQLIRDQELLAKKGKARIHFTRKTDVVEKKKIGLGLLEYRYSNAKTIITDIYNGLDNVGSEK